VGDAQGDGPAFPAARPEFDVLGRWEKAAAGMKYNYASGTSAHNVMVSRSGRRRRLRQRLQPATCAGRYGPPAARLGLAPDVAADRSTRPDGQIPVEVRFAHDPDKAYGFVGRR